MLCQQRGKVRACVAPLHKHLTEIAEVDVVIGHTVGANDGDALAKQDVFCKILCTNAFFKCIPKGNATCKRLTPQLRSVARFKTINAKNPNDVLFMLVLHAIRVAVHDARYGAGARRGKKAHTGYRMVLLNWILVRSKRWLLRISCTANSMMRALSFR